MHFILYNRPSRVSQSGLCLTSCPLETEGKICTLSTTELLQPPFPTQLNNKQTSPAQFGQVKSGSNISTNNGPQTISGNVENAPHEVSLTREDLDQVAPLPLPD